MIRDASASGIGDAVALLKGRLRAGSVPEDVWRAFVRILEEIERLKKQNEELRKKNEKRGREFDDIVVGCKIAGGGRSSRGARTRSRFTSVLRTMRQRGDRLRHGRHPGATRPAAFGRLTTYGGGEGI